jgi:uncharacterized membrane protein (DUF485 family)
MTSSKSSPTTEQILNSPEFKELIAERRKLSLPIIAVITIAYFGFILLVAFKPELLGQAIGSSKVSLGIVAGLGLLILSFLLTAVYMRLSDGKVAELQNKIHAKFN